MNSLIHALTFLTVLPMPQVAWRDGDLGRAAAWFPTVGLLLGAILCGAWWLLGQLFSPLITAVLLVTLWAALTGGLHLDGLADCGDGLLVAATAERRLDIMRDSRLGTFGAVSLILFLALKIAAVGELRSPLALLLAPTVGRLLILPTAQRPPARSGGLGAGFAAAVPRGSAMAGSIFVLLLALLIGWRGLAGIAAALLAAVGLWRLAQARIGGVTGDVMGAVIELAELAVLLVFAAEVV